MRLPPVLVVFALSLLACSGDFWRGCTSKVVSKTVGEGAVLQAQPSQQVPGVGIGEEAVHGDEGETQVVDGQAQGGDVGDGDGGAPASEVARSVTTSPASPVSAVSAGSPVSVSLSAG